ncbi:MAG: HAMP domain-containing sensor histidine kinase [Pseudomonadota bacterium]
MPISLRVALIGAAFGTALSMLVFDQFLYAATAGASCVLLALSEWQQNGWRTKHLDDLLEAFEDLPIPMAMYDAKERLILSNALYRSHHRETSIDLSNPRIRPSYDSLAAGNEALLASRKEAQRQIEMAIGSSCSPDGLLVEAQFHRIGWLRVGKRRLSGGGNVRVAIDINELKAREADLERAVERAQAADASKLQFLATLTHELRTPLNGVIGMAAVLLSAPHDSKSQRAIEAIKASGEHLLELVNQLLDYARIANHGFDLVDQEFDLRRLIEDVVNETRFAPQAAELDVSFRIPDDVPPLWRGCRIGIRQALTNLAGNAIKFTEAGSVDLEVRRDPQGVVFSVRDTGIGIAQNEIDRIFVPFEKLNQQEAAKSSGTGLGLAITAELVEGMSGKISVTSEVGVGSCFTVFLPIHPISERAQEYTLPDAKAETLLPRAS